MRIARIIEYFPPHIGGMERHGLILSQEQAKLGHDVEIFIGVGDTNIFPNTFKASLGFLPLYSRIRRFWFNFWAYFAVKRRHRKSPYNIIHLHGDIVEAYFGGLLSRKLKIKTILTIHGGLNPKILKKSNAKIFNGLCKIICVSREIESGLLSIGVDQKKLIIISSGIYLNEFNQPKSSLPYSKPVIISIGALTKQKGFEYLVSAFKIIKNRIPGASLLIIGNGPEKKNLRQKAWDISGIHLLGNLPHEKVVEYLLGGDIFALASVTMPGYHEGAPTSIMEAMAAGLPVIATKTGGVPYLVKDNINGILVGEKDADVIAETIINLFNNKELMAKIGAQNLEDIKQKDWPIIAKKITDAYNLTI